MMIYPDERNAMTDEEFAKEIRAKVIELNGLLNSAWNQRKIRVVLELETGYTERTSKVNEKEMRKDL